MLSYRHAFHAGNHADVLKHFILFAVLEYFGHKPKPFWYVDTHSGAGLYDLNGAQAQKVGEYRDGIARLQAAEKLSQPLADFVARIGSILPDPQLYCGSPWLAGSLLRADDKMRLFELHPADFALLQNNMREAGYGRRVQVKCEDGFKGLTALLPPPPRRAVVLIDPPYEQKQDYARTAAAVQDVLKRFAQGCYLVWYPCLSRVESAELPEKLQKLSPQNYLCAELYVHAPRADGFGMHGSGMFVVNPPYGLVQILERVLPELVKLLAQDAQARFVLHHQIA